MSSSFSAPTLAAAAAALSMALPSAAQSPAPSSAPAAAFAAKVDASDAKASVPPVTYRSAFAGYRQNTEEKVGSWKDANDKVGRIGGWRVYAKEAREPEAPAQSSKPMPLGPGGNTNK